MPPFGPKINGAVVFAASMAMKYDGYLLEGMACPGGCVAGDSPLPNPWLL